MLIRQADSIDIEALPQELRDRFPDVVRDLRDGAIEEVPDAVLDQLPTSVIDRIPDALLASDINMTFLIALAVIAAVALLGFVYGASKAAIKAAAFFVFVAAIAGIVIYTQI